MIRIMLRICALTDSLFCQSTLMLFLSFAVSSMAIFLSISSPISRSADSFSARTITIINLEPIYPNGKTPKELREELSTRSVVVVRDCFILFVLLFG